MGLSIHYSGQLKSDASLSELIEEVKNISEIQKWDYHIFEPGISTDNPEERNSKRNINGICFSPPKCEPVTLCFHANGRMCNPFLIDYFLNSSDKEDQDLIYVNYTKTQYSGIENHKIIIHLLRYISKKYFDSFSLTDEGNYWETNDEKILEERFNLYNQLMDSVASSLEKGKLKKGESIESYLERIFTEVHSRMKK